MCYVDLSTAMFSHTHMQFHLPLAPHHLAPPLDQVSKLV